MNHGDRQEERRPQRAWQQVAVDVGALPSVAAVLCFHCTPIERNDNNKWSLFSAALTWSSLRLFLHSIGAGYIIDGAVEKCNL